MTAQTLRERKKTHTRDALVAQAQALFLHRGYDSTTVDEIAAAANVSRRTFFRYFPTKEAVVFADRAERLERFRRLLEERRAGEHPLHTVRRACLALAVDYMRDRREVLAQHRIVVSAPALIARELELDLEWEAAIAHTLARSGSAVGMEQRRARILAGAVMGIIRATLREWFASNGTADLAELAATSFELLEGGITRHPGTP